MKNRFWIKNAFLILIQVIFTGALLLVYLSSTQHNRELFMQGKWGLITLLATVWVFISWRLLTRNIISYYNVFFLIAVLFHFGQAWIEFLSPDSRSYVSLSDFYSLAKINLAYFYTFCCLMIFHLFALIIAFINIITAKSKNIEQKKAPIDMKLLTAFGLILFIFSFFPKIMIDITLFGYVKQGGYLTIYDNPLSGTLWGIIYKLAGFFYPSVYILLFCLRNRKWQWNSLFYGVILYCLAYGFLIGNRGVMFMLIVSLILYRHFVYKKYNRKETLVLAGFALLVLMLSSIIALTRIAAKDSITVSSITRGIEGYNLVYSSISEFGGTIMSLLVGMKMIPEVLPFGNGITYLASTAVIIPDPIGIFNWLQPSVTFSGVLNKYHAGLGGSFIAEAYYNFGNYGFLFMGVLGLFTGYYLTKLDADMFDKTHSTSVIWASLMYLALLMYVRDQYYSICSGLLQYFIYPWVLYWLFKKILTLNRSRYKHEIKDLRVE